MSFGSRLKLKSKKDEITRLQSRSRERDEKRRLLSDGSLL
jgi:hypothetical protein